MCMVRSQNCKRLCTYNINAGVIYPFGGSFTQPSGKRAVSNPNFDGKYNFKNPAIDSRSTS